MNRRLILQWHINETCNCRCKHCYQDSYNQPDMSFEQIEKNVKQYVELLEKFSRKYNKTFQIGHINLTGGEPMLHTEFWNILKYLQSKKKYFSYGLLTNGTLINESNILTLKKLGVGFVQLSVEGNEPTHNEIRGKGNYKKVETALKLLVKSKITSLISFTAHKNNFRQFSDVCNLGRKLGVSKVWSDRIVPFGEANSLKNNTLSPEETKEYIEIMYREKKRWNFFTKKTEIAMQRGLQFLGGGEYPYSCQAGRNLLTILPNCDVLACRRMPIILGNTNSNTLSEIFFESESIKPLQVENNIPAQCKNCIHKNICRGGNKCLTYSLMQNLNYCDPGCWEGVNHIF